MYKNPDWTDEEIETLKVGAENGLSARTIGVMLGRSRNAVAGKAARIGVHLRAIPPRPPRPTPEPETFFDTLEIVPAEGIPIWNLGLMHCRSVNGDASNIDVFRYCGEPTVNGGSWCEKHAKLYLTAAGRAA